MSAVRRLWRPRRAARRRRGAPVCSSPRWRCSRSGPGARVAGAARPRHVGLPDRVPVAARRRHAVPARDAPAPAGDAARARPGRAARRCRRARGARPGSCTRSWSSPGRRRRSRFSRLAAVLVAAALLALRAVRAAVSTSRRATWSSRPASRSSRSAWCARGCDPTTWRFAALGLGCRGARAARPRTRCSRRGRGVVLVPGSRRAQSAPGRACSSSLPSCPLARVGGQQRHPLRRHDVRAVGCDQHPLLSRVPAWGARPRQRPRLGATGHADRARDPRRAGLPPLRRRRAHVPALGDELRDRPPARPARPSCSGSTATTSCCTQRRARCRAAVRIRGDRPRLGLAQRRARGSGAATLRAPHQARPLAGAAADDRRRREADAEPGRPPAEPDAVPFGFLQCAIGRDRPVHRSPIPAAVFDDPRLARRYVEVTETVARWDEGLGARDRRTTGSPPVSTRSGALLPGAWVWLVVASRRARRSAPATRGRRGRCRQLWRSSCSPCTRSAAVPIRSTRSPCCRRSSSTAITAL